VTWLGVTVTQQLLREQGPKAPLKADPLLAAVTPSEVPILSFWVVFPGLLMIAVPVPDCPALSVMVKYGGTEPSLRGAGVRPKPPLPPGPIAAAGSAVARAVTAVTAVTAASLRPMYMLLLVKAPLRPRNY
jgi:hypothetical protein